MAAAEAIARVHDCDDEEQRTVSRGEHGGRGRAWEVMLCVRRWDVRCDVCVVEWISSSLWRFSTCYVCVDCDCDACGVSPCVLCRGGASG